MKLEFVLQTKGEGVETILPSTPVTTLIEQLTDMKIGAMVVSSDGKTVEGIVSERDVVKHIRRDGTGILDGPVSKIMTPTVQCAPLNASTADMMDLMTHSRIRHVPVLDEDDMMVGIVSIGDVVKTHLAELEDERDALVQYVTVGG
ncbi:MAG: CBS domain-containing protein [Actinomycetia bacterium]|nr:CBS domain-containing protein [Actinomycetes bacterium]